MRKLWAKQNGVAVQYENFAPGAKFRIVRKFHTGAKISQAGAKISHPSAKLIFQLFSVLVSCILSFKNLTKTAKITQEKLKKHKKK